MENLLLEAYKLSETDRDKLNENQKRYLDKIFRIIIKICILNEESISILTNELRDIAKDIKDDPIFSDYSVQSDAEFSEFIPGSVSQ